MNIQEFIRLDDAKKQHEVWKYGTLLKNFGFGSEVFDVYKVFDFYVSLSFKMDSNIAVEINCQTFPEKLPLVKKVYLAV